MMAVLKEAVKRSKYFQSLALLMLMRRTKKCLFTTSHTNQCNLSMDNIAKRILRITHLLRQLLPRILGHLVDYSLLKQNRHCKFRASRVICQQLCFIKYRNLTKAGVCCKRWIKTSNSTSFFLEILT